jgi:hypothetical protein
MAIQQINLINPLFRKKKIYFSALMILKVSALTIITGLVLALFMNYRIGVMKNASTLDNIQLSVAQLALDKARSTSTLLEKNNVLLESLNKAEADAASLRKITVLLNQREVGNMVGNTVDNTTGYSATMQALARQIGSGIWLTGFTITRAGAEVSLRGKVLSPELVPAYLDRLKQEPAVRGLQFSALEMHLPKITGDKKSAFSPSSVPPVLEFSLQPAAVAASAPVPAALVALPKAAQ